MSVVIPILIATILGWLDLSGAKADKEAKTPIQLVDLDHSDLSRELQTTLEQNKNLRVTSVPSAQATSDVKEGKIDAAVVIPVGFSSLASAALTGGEKAKLIILEDPSKPLTPQVVEQIVYEQASKLVARQSFGALADQGSPVDISMEPVTAGSALWAKTAHDYSGFGLQGLLFFAVESGVVLSRERRSGVWKRLKSSPVPISLILLSRALSSTFLAFLIILLMFLVGSLLFGIGFRGSIIGFFGLAIASATMAATFGLLISTLGKTETQSRALSVLIIFLMLATGGAWFPLTQMPPLVQQIAVFLPVRWAVEGFDGTTWRGLSLASSAQTIGVLFLFSAVFVTGSLLRFATLKED
jgi:ABC-2 type transport system permease protein